MENKNFYMIVHNRYYLHEYEKDDYHLERILSNEQILKIIELEQHNFKLKDSRFENNNFIIVTNDSSLLSKYIFTISIDEFKALCKVEGFDKNKIRINLEFFDGFSQRDIIYNYFQKIFDEEIISASMSWEFSTVYPYDDDSIGVTSKYFDRWVENKEFVYFETPRRYKKDVEKPEIFNLPDYKLITLDLLNKIFQTNILDIGIDKTSYYYNWDSKKEGVLKYYANALEMRLFIPEQIFSNLRQDNSLKLKVDTKFTKDYYIEYHITEVDVPYDEDDFHQRNSNNDGSVSYEKYNGVYGLDDNTIDGAFEGDPENYWNID